MSNLLDKASIILTPTAYNNGKALCVKPSDGSGDFDFSRNSAATRVNAQGLVENVQILSSNLVQNGDFSEEGVEEVSNGSFSQEGVQLVTNGSFDTDSDWALGSGVNISDGKLNIDFVGAGNTAFQGISFTSGSTSKVVVVCSSYTSGRLDVRVGSNAVSSIIDGVGTYTFYIKEGGYPYINFFTGIGFNGSIDNVSVREVGQYWEIENTWTIGDGVANGNGAVGSTSELTQTPVNTIGKTYKATFEVLNYVSGTVGFWQGSGVSVINRSADGIYTEYFTATSAEIRFRPNNFNGSITNISVKEVGQNWNLGTGVIIANSKLTKNDPSVGNTSASQGAVFTVGKTYKYKLVVSGNLTASDKVVGFFTDFTSAGTYEGYFTANTTSLVFSLRGSTNVYSIDSVSVIEITDDTNLPRINYEGFIYQDALGSEEVVNGGFDDGENNWSFGGDWELVNGTAEILTSTNSFLVQSNVVDLSVKNYKLQYEVITTNGNNFRLAGGNSAFGTITLDSATIGVKTIYLTSNGTARNLQFNQNAFRGSIDNVSVKEYLGQEVVPDSGCGSWLWETQSTNLFTYSSDYTQWNKSGSMVITSNNAISPDGTQNASLLTANAANQFIYLSAFAAANSTISLYIKRKTGTGDIELSNNGGSSYTILSVTDEWNRVQVTFAAGTNQTVIKINTSGDEIYLWGAQLEQQSYATSYIPTSGSTVTRNQDVCTNGGSLASINSTSGVLYAEFKVFDSDNSYKMIEINDGSSSNNRVVLYVYGSNIFGFIKSNGNTNLNVFSAETVTNFNKVAIKWGSVDTALWVNGVEINTGTASTFTQNILSDLSFLGAGNQYFFGKTKALAVWKEALSDSELQSLTTI